MKVDILGTTYKIKRKKLKDEDVDGWCDNTSKTIIIRKDNYNNAGNFEYLMKKNIKHQFFTNKIIFNSKNLKKIDFEHLKQFGHEETMIDWIAIQFPKIYEVYKEVGAID